MNELIQEIHTSTKYIIEELLSEHRVHLIGGPSGSGKTTLMFQMFDAIAKGEPFLGRQTRPIKLAYIAADRSATAVRESMERVGVSLPVFSLVDENLVNADLIDLIFPRLTAVCGYRPDFIYIDGFTAMAPGGFMNNYVIVAKWLARLTRYCEKMKITLLGACHTTKTKEGEKFLNPRQRIAGSVAWAGFTEGIIIIEPPDDAKNDKLRLVSLLPRNHAPEHITLTFNDQGRLVVPPSIAHQEEATNFVMDTVMEVFVPGEEITLNQLWNLAEKRNMAKRTFMRWLAKYVEHGKLVKEQRGSYVIPRPSEPVSVQ